MYHGNTDCGRNSGANMRLIQGNLLTKVTLLLYVQLKSHIFEK